MSDLFRVTVLLNVPGSSLNFTFKDGARALEASNDLMTTDPFAKVVVHDDFGCICEVKRDAIVAVNLAEIGRQLEGEAELAMAQALKNAELQKRAQTDVRLNSGLVVPSAHAGTFRKQ